MSYLPIVDRFIYAFFGGSAALVTVLFLIGFWDTHMPPGKGIEEEDE